MHRDWSPGCHGFDLRHCIVCLNSDDFAELQYLSSEYSPSFSQCLGFSAAAAAAAVAAAAAAATAFAAAAADAAAAGE